MAIALFTCLLIQTQTELRANGRPSTALWVAIVNRAHSQRERLDQMLSVTPSFRQLPSALHILPNGYSKLMLAVSVAGQSRCRKPRFLRTVTDTLIYQRYRQILQITGNKVHIWSPCLCWRHARLVWLAPDLAFPIFRASGHLDLQGPKGLRQCLRN